MRLCIVVMARDNPNAVDSPLLWREGEPVMVYDADTVTEPCANPQFRFVFIDDWKGTLDEARVAFLKPHMASVKPEDPIPGPIDPVATPDPIARREMVFKPISDPQAKEATFVVADLDTVAEKRLPDKLDETAPFESAVVDAIEAQP